MINTFTTLRTLLLLAVLSLNGSVMAQNDYYWVGGSGDWSDYENHWATSSGGSSFHTEVPDEFDHVIFDVNSFSQDDETVTINAPALCGSIEDKNARVHSLDINDRLVVVGDLILDGSAYIANNHAQITLTGVGSLQVENPVENSFSSFYISGGEYTLTADLEVPSLILNGNSLTTNGHSLILESFLVSGASPGNDVDLTLDNSSLYVEQLEFSGTPTSFSDTDATIYLQGTLISRNEFDPQGLTFNSIVFEGTKEVLSSFSAETIRFVAGSSTQFADGITVTVTDNLTVEGEEGSLATLYTESGATTPATIDISNTSDVSLNFGDFTDLTFSDPVVAYDSEDGGGNTNIIFPKNYFWVGGSGDWSDPNQEHWATTSAGTTFHSQAPTKYDSVYFDSNSFATDGEEVIIDESSRCHDLTFDQENEITIRMPNTLEVYGSISLDENVDTSGKEVINLKGENEQKISILGEIQGLVVDGTALYELHNDLSLRNKLDIVSGSLNFNNKGLSSTSLVSTGISNRFIDFTSSTLILEKLDFDSNGLAVIGTDATIHMNGDKKADEFKSAGFSFKNVFFYGLNTVKNSFESVNIFFKTGSETQFTDGITVTATDTLEVAGVAGDLTSLYTESGATTPAAIDISGASEVSLNYGDFTDLTFSDPVVAYDSEDGGGNTNIIFPKNYYWVGGSGDWSDPNQEHWATESNGTEFHTQVPTQYDTVYFDENSFSQDGETITIDADAECGALYDEGASSHMISLQNKMYIYGDLILDQNVNVTSASVSDPIYLEGTGSHTLEIVNPLPRYSTIYIRNGSYLLSEDISLQKLVIIGSSSFNTQKNNLTTSGELNLETEGNIVLDDSNLYLVELVVLRLPSLFSGKSTKYFFQGYLISHDIDLHGLLSLNHVFFEGNNRIASDFSASRISFQSDSKTQLAEGITVTATDTLEVAGEEGDLAILYTESGATTPATIDISATSEVSLSYGDFTDLTFSDQVLAYDSEDGGGNTNILFKEDYFWVGGSGSWSDFENHWATTSNGSTFHTQAPTQTDRVFFDENSLTVGDIITMDIAAECASLVDTSALAHTFDFQGQLMTIYGDFLLGTEVDVTNGHVIILQGKNSSLLIEGELTSYPFVAIKGDYTLSGGTYLGGVNMEGGLISDGKRLTLTGQFDLFGGARLDFDDSVIEIEDTFFFQDVPSNITFSDQNAEYHIKGSSSIDDVFEPSGLSLTGDVYFFGRNRVAASFSAPVVAFVEDGSGEESPEVTFNDGVTVTATEEMYVVGTEDSPVVLSASDSGDPAILDASNQFMYIEYADLTNITSTDNVVAELSIDGGGNTNIEFPEINFSTLEAKTYGDDAFELTAESNIADRPVTYRSTDEEVATVDGTTVSILGAGTTTITASSQGAFDVSQELVINKASLRVAVDADQSKAYGADVPALTFSYNVDDFALNEDETEIDTPPVVATTATRESEVDTYPLTLSDGEDDNYSFVYEDGELEVTPATLSVIVNEKQSKVYGEAVPDLTFRYEGFVLDEDEKVINTPPSITSAVQKESNVGEYPVTVERGAVDNYTFDYVDGIFNVTPAALRVTVDAGQSKVYGAEVPSLTFSYNADDFVLEDDATDIDTPPVATTEATQASPVGEYLVTLSDGEDDNYTFDYDESGTFEVTPAVLNVTVDENQSKVYGAEVPALSFSYNADDFVLGDDATDIDTPPVATTDATQASPVGEYSITLSDGEDDNYSFVYDENGKLAVTQAMLNVRAEDKSKVFGEALPELTVEYQGFVLEDSEEDLDVVPTLETEATIDSEVNENGYSITFSRNAQDANYFIVHEIGTLTVTKAPQEISWGVLENVDLIDNIVEIDLRGLAESSVGLEVTVELVSGPATLNDKLLTLEGTTGTVVLRASQEGSQNYQAATSVETSFTVFDSRKTDQVITFGALTAVRYGDASFDLSATSDSGLEVSYTSSDETVATVTGSTVTIVGAGQTTITASQEGNADFNPATAVAQELTVNQKTLTVTAEDQEIVYGEAIPTLTYIYAGFVSGEDETDLFITPVATTEADQNSDAGEYEITVSGGLDDNYAFEYEPGTLTILQATQTITWQTLNNVDLADNDLTVDLTNVVEATSGLSVTVEVLSGPATLSGTTLTLDGTTGTVVLQASQAGNTNYLAAAEVTTSFNVTDTRKADQEITFEALTAVTFGAAAFDLTATTTAAGLTVSYTSSDETVATVTGSTVTIVGAGETTITAYQGGDEDTNPATPVSQVLTVSKATPMITFEALDVVELNQGTLTLTATTTSTEAVSYTSSDVMVATVSGNTVTLLALGTTTITASVAEGANYTAATASQELEVVERILGLETQSLLTIYPNPASDYLKIKGDYQSLTIRDLQGRAIRTYEMLDGDVLSIEDLSSGTYLLEYEDDQGVQHTIRFMKKE